MDESIVERYEINKLPQAPVKFRLDDGIWVPCMYGVQEHMHARFEASSQEYLRGLADPTRPHYGKGIELYTYIIWRILNRGAGMSYEASYDIYLC